MVLGEGVNALRDDKRAFIIVTHYQRILTYIKPDYVHVLYRGGYSDPAILLWSNNAGGAGLWLAYRTAVKRYSNGSISLKKKEKVELSKQDSILQQMLRLGLPTRKHEDWEVHAAGGATHSQFIQRCATISAAQRDALALQIDAVRLVFVDGRFYAEAQ